MKVKGKGSSIVETKIVFKAEFQYFNINRYQDNGTRMVPACCPYIVPYTSSPQRTRTRLLRYLMSPNEHMAWAAHAVFDRAMSITDLHSIHS